MNLTLNTNLNLPINTLINTLSKNKGSPICFNELKQELQRKNDNNNPVYYIQLKEDPNLCLLYYNGLPENDNNRELETSCRSYIFEKSSFKPIASQFNKILYNEEAINFLKEKSWSNVMVEKCYEGTLILVFNYNNKWYISTRRCLNASESTWIKNSSYLELFNETIKDKFGLEDLDKKYCYHFILVHNKNKNIVSYDDFGKDYKEIFHIMTTEQETLLEVPYKINDNVRYIEKETFNSMEEVMESLNKINTTDQQNKKVSLEGYVLKYYHGEPNKSNFTILKLQTQLYQSLMKLKPNNSNIYQSFLELYQKDKLIEFLPYFSRYGDDIFKRIHYSMKTISKELLDVYHLTRQKKNPQLYNALPDSYKKVLYNIHGIYIKNKKDELNKIKETESENKSEHPDSDVDLNLSGSVSSVTVHTVYYYLKRLTGYELRQIYYDRSTMLDNNIFTFLNRRCMYTITQTMSMFRNNNQQMRYIRQNNKII